MNSGTPVICPRCGDWRTYTLRKDGASIFACYICEHQWSEEAE